MTPTTTYYRQVGTRPAPKTALRSTGQIAYAIVKDESNCRYFFTANSINYEVKPILNTIGITEGPISTIDCFPSVLITSNLGAHSY